MTTATSSQNQLFYTSDWSSPSLAAPLLLYTIFCGFCVNLDLNIFSSEPLGVSAFPRCFQGKSVERDRAVIHSWHSSPLLSKLQMHLWAVDESNSHNPTTCWASQFCDCGSKIFHKANCIQGVWRSSVRLSNGSTNDFWLQELNQLFCVLGLFSSVYVFDFWQLWIIALIKAYTLVFSNFSLFFMPFLKKKTCFLFVVFDFFKQNKTKYKK